MLLKQKPEILKKIVDLYIMSKRSHISIFIFSLGLAIVFGGLDYATHSMLDLFLNKGKFVALVIYSLLFMAVTYTGVWMYIQAKLLLKKKPTN
jgi:hypothetical protein